MTMMTPADPSRTLRLHFEGELTHGHTLPASALVQALQQLQRVVHLLALAREGREGRQRLRTTHDIERRYPLICGLSETGGYAQRVTIGDADYDLQAPEDAESVADQVRLLLNATQAGDYAAIQNVVPLAAYRRPLLRSLKAMVPSRRSGLVLHIEDASGAKMLDGTTVLKGVAKLIEQDRDALDLEAPAPGYVTGRLVEIDVENRQLKLQSITTGQGFTASYSDDDEPTVLSHPRELIQVHGNVLYRADGQPESVSEVDEVLAVDERPLEVAAFQIDNRIFTAHRPVSFVVAFDRAALIYQVTGPFDVDFIARTRPEAEQLLDDELAVLWDEYASVEPDQLTEAAQRLRDQLRATFRESDDAA